MVCPHGGGRSVGAVMEETKPRPGFPGDRSQAAAEKLRALRERANQALDDHRRRLGEIEGQLSDRVRHLAEEFGAAQAAAGQATTPAQEEELAALRRQLDEGRAKHDKFVEQLVAARKQLDAIQSQPCTTCQHAAEQLAAAEEETRRLREQVEIAARRHEEDRQRHEKFVEQLQAARQAITVLQHSAGESAAELRGELETARTARSAVEEQLAAAAHDLEVLHAECDATRARAEGLEQELAAARAESESLRQQASALGEQHGAAANEAGALQSRAQELDAQLQQSRFAEAALQQQTSVLQDQVETLQREAESLGAQLADLQATSADSQGLAERAGVAEEEAERLRRQLTAAEGERLTLALAVEQAEGAVVELRGALAAAEERLAAAEQQAAAGTDAATLRKQLEQAHAAADERVQLIGELKKTLDDARSELDDLRTTMTPRAEFDAVERQRQSEHAQLELLQQTVAALQAEVDEAKRQTSDAQAEAAHAQAELSQAQADAARLLADAQAAVAQSTATTAALHEASRPAAEFDELQHKFDLALADVQKLKRENGNLREELAARPEAGDDQSCELSAVRSERDELALRVAELEQASAAAATVDGDSQQERDDLQRRFELAVDDVRQLKQENAQLRDKLAAGGGGSAGGIADDGGGGSDWAAQRARLMAMLEEEDGEGDVGAERTAERATVQKTIAATDRVVANKDQEIAELRAALESRPAATAADAEEQQRRDEILDADELVAAERQRLAALTVEWEEKLRAAELEFSVERAKLAREQAALREKTFDLEKSAPQTSGGEPVDVSKPRRRWLAALGLHEDDDEKKKKK